jgi:hypothetical protein
MLPMSRDGNDIVISEMKICRLMLVIRTDMPFISLDATRQKDGR